MKFSVLSQFELLSLVTFFFDDLSFWILSQFEFSSFVTVWVLSFVTAYVFEFYHDLSFDFLLLFLTIRVHEFRDNLSFVNFLVLEFRHHLSFGVFSQLYIYFREKTKSFLTSFLCTCDIENSYDRKNSKTQRFFSLSLFIFPQLNYVLLLGEILLNKKTILQYIF